MKKKLIKFVATSLLIVLSSSMMLSCSGESKTVMNVPVEKLKISTPNNVMGFNLFQEVNKSESNKNVVLSPLSLSASFSLLQNGAVGNTQDELLNFLNLKNVSENDINLDNKAFYDYINSLKSDNGQLNLANSIWIRKNYEIKDEFIKTAKDYYNAYVKSISFSKPSAVKQINKWVYDNTNGKINNVVDDIGKDTVSLIINALYFESLWRIDFSPNETQKGNFNMSNGKTTEVDYMHVTNNFQYGKFDNYELIKLPYRLDGFSMNIILPKDDVKVDDFIKTLNYDKWKDSMSKLEIKPVSLTMPKFKLEYEKDLNETLKNLGVKDAFNPEKADFSNMADNVYVSDVLQKTFIDVNESGTKAGAVTKIEIKTTSFFGDNVVKFNMDRPFIFTIYDEVSDMILFVGKIESPNK